ncbi:MAG: hypothetical protein EBX99_13535, partial [Acidimicrobiia bacterium]|nr:hypothetical protein [Acidimicrobiia bacterium]
AKNLLLFAPLFLAGMFDDAHAIVGALVRRSLAGEGALVDLVRAEPRLGADAASLVAPGVGVRMRTTPGGAGPRPVAVQIENFATAVRNWKQAVE